MRDAMVTLRNQQDKQGHEMKSLEQAMTARLAPSPAKTLQSKRKIRDQYVCTVCLPEVYHRVSGNLKTCHKSNVAAV
jgi:hypothetical protein